MHTHKHTPATLLEFGVLHYGFGQPPSMNNVLLALQEAIPPRRREALGHHQCQGGVGIQGAVM